MPISHNAISHLPVLDGGI